MLRTGEFVDTVLPIVIEKASRPLHVLFLNYNRVLGYESGPVPFGLKDIEITVINGEARLFKAVALAQRSLLREAVKLIGSRDLNTLVFIYAGINGLSYTIDTIRKLKLLSKRVEVCVLTCDCYVNEKKELFQPLVKDNIVKNFITTNECGGVKEMARILDVVVSTCKY